MFSLCRKNNNDKKKKTLRPESIPSQLSVVVATVAAMFMFNLFAFDLTLHQNPERTAHKPFHCYLSITEMNCVVGNDGHGGRCRLPLPKVDRSQVAVIVRYVLLRHDGTNSFRMIHSNFLLLGARPAPEAPRTSRSHASFPSRARNHPHVRPPSYDSPNIDGAA